MSIFLQRLIKHAALRPEHVAVVSDDIELTYARLADSVVAACSTLKRMGINSASVVGLTIPDEIDHFIATLALVKTINSKMIQISL